MRNEISCGAVVYTMRNGEPEFVIVRSLHGIFGFPKGHMESGETQQETALREIYEETGLQPVIVNGFQATDEYRIPDSGITKQVVYFLTQYTDQKIQVRKEELMEVSLMDYDTAINVLQYESSQRILREAYCFIRSMNDRSAE